MLVNVLCGARINLAVTRLLRIFDRNDVAPEFGRNLELLFILPPIGAIR